MHGSLEYFSWGVLAVLGGNLDFSEPPGHLCLDSPAWRAEPGLQPGVPRHRAGTFANEVYGTADLSKRGASRWEEAAVAQLGLRACPGAAGSH